MAYEFIFWTWYFGNNVINVTSNKTWTQTHQYWKNSAEIKTKISSQTNAATFHGS